MMSTSTGKISKLFQHSAIYSISTSVQRLQSLILMPIYTNIAYIPSTSQYSNYGLIYTFIAFMNYFYFYGMDSAFLRYFFLGDSDQKKVYSSTFFILCISGFFTSILLVLFAKPIAELILLDVNLATIVRLAAAILFFDTIGNFPFLLLRAREQAVTFTSFRMLRFGLELLLNVVFVVVLKKGVLGILYANIWASLINLIIMLPFTLRYLEFNIDFSLVKKMLLFGLPFLPNGIAYTAIEMIDRTLIPHFLDKNVLAIYHANYKFAAVLLLLIVGFRNAWQPFFLKIAKEASAKETYVRILNYYLFAAGMLLITITFFIREILTYKFFGKFYILADPAYWAGIDFIPLIIFSYFLYGTYVIFTPAFYITKKSKYMFYFTGCGALVNIGLNVLLLPTIGIWGAVWATVAAYSVMAVLIYLVSSKIYPTPVNLFKLFAALALVGSGLFIYYILHPAWWIKLLLLPVFGIVFYQLLMEQGTLSRLKKLIKP